MDAAVSIEEGDDDDDSEGQALNFDMETEEDHEFIAADDEEIIPQPSNTPTSPENVTSIGSAASSSTTGNIFVDAMASVEEEEDDDDDDEVQPLNFDVETEEDREFINDGENDEDEDGMHRSFDNQRGDNNNNNNNNNNSNNNDNMFNKYPSFDYRRNPYSPPELNESQQRLFDELFSLICEKGVFFYEYVTNPEVLNETSGNTKTRSMK